MLYGACGPQLRSLLIKNGTTEYITQNYVQKRRKKENIVQSSYVIIYQLQNKPNPYELV